MSKLRTHYLLTKLIKLELFQFRLSRNKEENFVIYPNVCIEGKDTLMIEDKDI